MKNTDSVASVSQLLKTLRAHIALPLTLSLAFVAVACIMLWRAPALYEARVSITARAPQTDPLAGLGNMGFGLLGNLAGSATFTDFDRLMALITSDDTASRLLEHDPLMASLFGDTWNTQQKSWNQPTGVGATVRRMVAATFGLPGWTSPRTEPVIGLLEDRLRITRSEGGAISTISLRAGNPETSLATLRLLVESADGLLRERAKRVNVDNIDFLRRQIASEQILEVRSEIANQLAQELSKSSLLESDSSYSYAILRDYYVTALPVSPRPTFSLALAVLAGLLAGIAIAILRSSDWARRKQPR